MARVFHVLVKPGNAQKILADESDRLKKSVIKSISEASRYVSAEDVYSTEDVPPFDRSEVDGYAVDHKWVEGSEEDSPTELEVVGEIEIGKYPKLEIKGGQAAYISTGSALPRGADSVVMVEYTSRTGDDVKIFRSVVPGENIAHAGSDFFVSEPLLRKNGIVSSENIALLASSGISRIKVYDKLKIGIISTGNELVSPGGKIKQGEIYDSNAYYFKSILEGTGLAECSLLGTLPDDRKKTEDFIDGSKDRYDVLISSGSTSAGFHDLLYKVIEDLGGKMLFHGISIKPGKPTFAATFETSIFLGMPGFPLSAGSVMRYIVVPAIQSAFEFPEVERRLVVLPFRINSERGKDLVLPAIISRSKRAYPIFGESGSISRLAYADGFIVIGSKKSYYEMGERVPFFPLGHTKREILFIGSNDPLMERVILDASRYPTIINAGSWGGVDAIRAGEADISGVHLLKNGEYNTFLLREGDQRKYVMLRGFSRTQGWVSRSGVSSFSKVLRGNLTFVNRNKGSGTRDLIESEIERELGHNFERENIRGYYWEAKSHAAVAKAVQQGRADAGISIQFYATILGLKFHKIRDENYDILIQRDFFNSKHGKKLVLELKKAKKYSMDFPGYLFPQNIGDTIS